MRILSLVLCLAVLAPAVPIRAAEPPAANTALARLAAAEKLAAEGSWSLARDAYAAALKLASTDSSKRLLQIRLADATWRASQPQRNAAGNIRYNWYTQNLAVLDELIGPETPASIAARDSYWAAAVASRADLKNAAMNYDPWPDRIAVAAYLAEKPPSPQAAELYIAFLQHCMETNQGISVPAQFSAALEDGFRVGLTADDRAWCALQIALLPTPNVRNAGDSPLELAASRWVRALKAAEGTVWQVHARAAEFAWRITTGRDPELPPNSPADFPALLTQLAAVRQGLNPAAGDQLTTSIRNSLAQLESEWTRGQLRIQISPSNPAGEPLRFSYGTTGFSQLRFRIAGLTPQAWANLQSPPQGVRLTTPTGTTIKDWTVALPDPGTRVWKSDFVDIAALEPGYYYLLTTATGPGNSTSSSRQDFIVSAATAAAFAGPDGSASLFLLNPASGAPLAGVSVTALTGGNGIWRTWTGKTGIDGLARIPGLNADAPQSVPQHMIVATADGQPVWMQYYANNIDRFMVDTFLDRPLYRPGETVHWKMIVRELRNGRLIVPNRTFQMTVQKNEEKFIDKKAVTLNAFGTASGEIVLPATTKPGSAQLVLDVKGASVLYRGELFVVDNYVPPAIDAKINLASGADSLRPGRDVVVRVESSYLSGGPVTGALVECNFSNGGSLAPTVAQYQIQQYASWQKDLETAREGKTDAAGTAEFHLQLPNYLPATSTLDLNVRVVPDGGQAVQTSRNFTVTTTGSIVDAPDWSLKRLVRPEEPVSFTAGIVDGAGDPRSFTGSAMLMELRWSEAWLSPDGRVVGGDDLAVARRQLGLAPYASFPQGWRQLQAAMNATPVASIPVQAGADGKVSATFSMPHAGYYQVQFGQDNLLLSSKQYGDGVLAVVAADDKTVTLPADPRAFQIVAPQKVGFGELLRVLVVMREGETSALLSIQGEDAEISQRVDLRGGRAGIVTIENLPPALNEVQLSLASAQAANGRSSARALVLIENPALRLNVALSPADDKLKPGAASSVRISVKDSTGRPVRAELAVAGSDDAVNKLSRQTARSVPSFFESSATPHWFLAQMVAPRPVLAKAPDPRRGAIRNPKNEAELSRSLPFSAQAAAAGAAGGGRGGGGSGEAFDAKGDNVVRMNPFEVVESEDASFTTNFVGAGSRVKLDLSDTLVPYSVMNRQFIDALGITDMREAASWAPGMTFASSESAPGVAIEVRRHFSSTILWDSEVVTDAQGEATVPVKYADNLTQWRFEAFAVGADGSTFGRAASVTHTSLPVQSRLQLPRFLVKGDSARASALLLNRTDADMTAGVSFKVDGAVSLAQSVPLQRNGIAIPKQGETQEAWLVKAMAPGSAKFSVEARAGTEGDAMAIELPVMEDGIQQQLATTGRMPAGQKSQIFTLTLPDRLERNRTNVEVHLAPSYAATILDALPYLVDYPYGCIEQTMNRFMPAVVVRKALVDLGFSAEQVERRILGKESPSDAARRARTAGLGRLAEVTKLSVAKIAESSSRDGGFGWWPGAPTADPWMTAYVIWGAVLAREAGVELPPELDSRLKQGVVTFANGRLTLPVDVQGRTGNGSDPSADGSVALLLAAGARLTASRASADADLLNIFERLYDARERLPAAGRACLLLAAGKLATPEERAVLLRNLETGAQRSQGPGLGDTVHWGSTANYWYAMDGAVEATSLTLLALLDLDPKNPLIEPAANWLLLNRRSSHWDSTRSTAFAVLALTRYIVVRNEARPDVEAELLVNGRSAGRVAFTPDSLLEDPAPIAVDTKLLKAGSNRFELRRIKGTGPVYATVLASSWADSSIVKPAGNLISIARTLERMKPQATLIGTVRLVPEDLPDNGSAVAGEQVTAHVRVSVPNDMEYVMVEVPKPAGLEPLNSLSGWDARLSPVAPSLPVATSVSKPTPPASAISRPASLRPAPSQAIYREEHDDRSVFFLSRIAAGEWEIRYTMRATTAGDFRALPAEATAMYVPEVRANSDARRLRITEKEQTGLNR